MFLYSLLDSVTWYPFLFDTPFNAIRAVAIWVTLFALTAYLVCLFVLKSDKRKAFFSKSVYGIVGYVCALAALALVLSFIEDGIEVILFVPLLVLLTCIALSAVALLFKRTRAVTTTAGIVCLGALIATLVCMGVHFLFGDAAENNWLANEDVQSAALYIGSGLSVLALVLVAGFFGKSENKEFDSKSVAFAAVCIAMSFALSYLRLVRLPQGGSITPASLLPLMVYAYLFGVRKGVFVGFTYGLLQALQDPSVLHPAQFLLDYPVAFAWIGLAGAFTKVTAFEKYPQVQFALGAVIAGLGRFAMHFLSGAFAFGSFAPEGTPVLLYSFVYQAGYVLPDLAIAVVAGIALLSSKSFVKEVRSMVKINTH